jgi:hypothetical protein
LPVESIAIETKHDGATALGKVNLQFLIAYTALKMPLIRL